MATGKALRTPTPAPATTCPDQNSMASPVPDPILFDILLEDDEFQSAGVTLRQDDAKPVVQNGPIAKFSLRAWSGLAIYSDRDGGKLQVSNSAWVIAHIARKHDSQTWRELFTSRDAEVLVFYNGVTRKHLLKDVNSVTTTENCQYTHVLCADGHWVFNNNYVLSVHEFPRIQEPRDRDEKKVEETIPISVARRRCTLCGCLFELDSEIAGVVPCISCSRTPSRGETCCKQSGSAVPMLAVCHGWTLNEKEGTISNKRHSLFRCGSCDRLVWNANLAGDAGR